MSSTIQQERIHYIQSLFENNPELFNHSKIPELKPRGNNRVVAMLPLRIHNIYGETVLFINELYDDNDKIHEYRYGWELKKTNKEQTKHDRHITAFDKQEHPKPPYWVETDPYHHHNVPGAPKERVETSVKTLKDVIVFLQDYIPSHQEFLESHRF